MSESSSRASSRVSPEQLDILLTFMEEHLDFARGKQSIYSRFSSCKLWRLLTERLNAAASGVGGTKKSPDKWCRYWADMKYRGRKRAFNSSGELNQTEERLRNILGSCDTSNNSKYKLDSSNSRVGDMDEDVSEGSEGDNAPISTEEILAEAAMRSALAAEKQAEAMTQAVDLLKEIVTLLRPSQIPPPPLHHHQQQPHPSHHRL